jgi:hypothetical protein
MGLLAYGDGRSGSEPVVVLVWVMRARYIAFAPGVISPSRGRMMQVARDVMVL